MTDKLYNYRAANEKRAQKHYLKTLQTEITDCNVPKTYKYRVESGSTRIKRGDKTFDLLSDGTQGLCLLLFYATCIKVRFAPK